MMDELQEFEPMPTSRQRRVAVFGGSFDPVHNGHLFIAGEIVRGGLVDEVLFVPARTPPHKQTRILSPSDNRMAMLREAVNPYTEFSVSDIELVRGDSEPSYTIDTLELLGGVFPDHDLYFLLGTDSLADLHTWHRAAELVSRHDFLIYPRGDVESPTFATLASRFSPRLARKLVNAHLPLPAIPVSATAVRRLAGQHGNLAGMIPESVADYIGQHGLYRKHKDIDRTHD